MGKHNDKEFQEKIKMSFRHNLEKQFRNGLAQGMYAACKVICDKAQNEEKTIEDRINEIVTFCQQIIKPKTPNTGNAQKVVE